MNKATKKISIAGHDIILETGELAFQATSAVMARAGDTMVLATVVEGKERTDIDYFPLSVEFAERLYAGGKIKGSRWVKREGRPSDEAILSGRLIDRSIRPLFPKEYKRDVQVVVTVLSVDGENEPDVLGIVAVAAALNITSIPWNGPVSAVRMGLVTGEGKEDFIVNPGREVIEASELDLVVTQTKEKTLMLEAGARQVPEDKLLEAIKKAHEYNIAIINGIEEFAKEVGTVKQKVTPDSNLAEMKAVIEKNYKSELTALIKPRATKEGGSQEYDALIEKIFTEQKTASPEAPIDKKTIAKAAEYVFYKIIRENVVKKGERPDGRKVDEIRQISGKVDILPRTHGSAIFQRGSTQALTIATLASPRLGQLIESAEGEETKTYIHHYSMPPYSVGETGRMIGPSRREVGHGALAERALMAVIPSADKFPYTIRVVSEILSSNGSTSMAATCGSTLALMDAGVPIIKPVSGIAMGMMSLPSSGQADDAFVILTDIIGLEDFSGDMDFKVAGTDEGVTAIQLDVKIAGLTFDQIGKIFEKAKVGRMFILEKMLSVINTPKAQVSEYAPKIEVVKIPVEKIGEVIGPGGRMIKSIIAQTTAQVDVEDDGSVTISSNSEEAVAKAVNWVEGLVREVKVGEEFEGTVKRILPFGAFVEVLPGKEGMVHVSQMSTGFVNNPSEVVTIGDAVKVRVMEIDDQGRINLSMLFGEDAKEKANRAAPVVDKREERAPHPLSMQFRRERETKFGQRTGSRPRFRKPLR